MIFEPSPEKFKELSKDGTVIPVYSEIVADMETPVSAYYKLCANGEEENYSFLLESVEGGENIARYSFIGLNPHAVFIHNNGRGELIKKNGREEINGKDVFKKLHNVLGKYEFIEILKNIPFIGGAVGYASYDLISEIETSVKKPDKDDEALPEAVFMIPETILVFDRVIHNIKILSLQFLENSGTAEKQYEAAVRKIKNIVEQLKRPISIPQISSLTPQSNNDLEYSSNKTKEEFSQIVNKTKDYILNGDIIQAVLSQRFTVNTEVPPLSLYRALRMVNPSPYMFLLNCKDFAVVGASPEVHAKCSGGDVTLRPIAGTRKRGKTENKDLEQERDLLADEKEKAEHIMLVDLARNDIGRIAEAGSVKVNELMSVERYSHVMHLVSNVKAKLDKGLKADSVMRNTFPAGTVSGAPKVRAMQIISELEKEKRGPYSGVVAYYSFNGNVDSCIAIRTAVVKKDKVLVQAGAGIVADSEPEKEYEETQNKARALIKAVSLAHHFKK